MTDTTWSIETKSNGTITADALTADWPTVTRGSRARLRLWFDYTGATADKPLIVEDGETYTISAGDSETRPYVRVEDGGTLNVDGTLTIDPDAMFTLLQYLDYADAAAYSADTLNHRPWYHEQLPPEASEPHTNINSIVLGFEPPDFQQERGVPGIWGIVVGGSDARNSTLTNWQAELQVFVLGEYPEYADHAAVESDLAE